MKKSVLITGGAGFIGSHLANDLLSRGYSVRVLDVLTSQVHGGNGKRPAHLNRDVELIRGDIRNPDIVDRALKGVDALYHFASLVGVGQSMFQVEEYTSVNTLGTATVVSRGLKHSLQKIIVASSMSIYGEGLYKSSSGDLIVSAKRSQEQLRRNEWDPCSEGGERLSPLPTPEWKPADPQSIYALSKYDQERMCLVMGRAYGIPAVALRFFNVYGPHQALSNPYTGVLAIFASRLINGQPPVVFEDGNQLRDFVCIHDIVQACRLALEKDAADVSINVGSGDGVCIREVAERMAVVLQKEIAPRIEGTFRAGDVRHCFPDIQRAKELLGYKPAYNLDRGIRDLAEWLEGQVANDNFPEMQKELARWGLVG